MPDRTVVQERESKRREGTGARDGGQGKGRDRNLILLLASTKFTQTLLLFCREANYMFSGLTTLSTLKDVLNYTLDGYLCVMAFAGFPSPYV